MNASDAIGRSLLAGTLMIALLGGAARAGVYDTPLLHVRGTNGTVIVAERNGRTLYVLVNERGGGARCGELCAIDWPPFEVRPVDFPCDGLGIVHRDDGMRQWTLDGRPLHFFAGDRRRGDADGDGIGGWRALRPADVEPDAGTTGAGHG